MYNILSLQNCSTPSKYQHMKGLLSKYSETDIVIPFDGECVLLLYVLDFCLKDVKTILKSNKYDFMDMRFQVSKEDALKFLKNAESHNHVAVGDVVTVLGYGNAPFVVTSTTENSTVAKINLFNYSFSVSLPNDHFSKHQSWESIKIFDENIKITRSTKYCVIDIPYILSSFHPQDIKQKIFILIKIKSIIHNGGSAVLYCPDEDYMKIAEMFGLSTTTQLMASNSLVSNEKSELFMYTNKRYSIVNRLLVKENSDMVDKFIGFLARKNYTFSKEQVIIHWTDQSRFFKQRQEFFEEISSTPKENLLRNKPSMKGLSEWLLAQQLGEIEENLSFFVKKLYE